MPANNFKQLSATTMNDAFAGALRDLLTCGTEVKARGDTVTVELMHYRVRICEPQHRVMMFPHRRNNPFATLFETLWVLAGENDAKELKFFLPRAMDFSDDGKVWRAGYGPRLRRAMGFDDKLTSAIYQDDKLNWPNAPSTRIDQIKKAHNTLKADPSSRQAVMTIWDPAKECTIEKSKDFPCCNRVALLIRDDKLHLTLNMRSNDILWGFSAINVYEFTALQEFLASLLGVGMGQYQHAADSFHAYKSGGFNAENNFARLRAMFAVPDTQVEWHDNELSRYKSGPVGGTWAFQGYTYDEAIATLEKEYRTIVQFTRVQPRKFGTIRLALRTTTSPRVAMCLLYIYYMKAKAYAESGEEDCYMPAFTVRGMIEMLQGWNMLDASMEEPTYTEDMFSCVYWILRTYDRQFSNGAERKYRDKMEDAMADAHFVLANV